MTLGTGAPKVVLIDSKYQLTGMQQVLKFKEPHLKAHDYKPMLNPSYQDEGETIEDISATLRAIERGMRPEFAPSWTGVDDNGHNAMVQIVNHAKSGGYFRFYPNGEPSDPDIWFLCLLTAHSTETPLLGRYDLGWGPVSLTFTCIRRIMAIPTLGKVYYFCSADETGYDSEEICHFSGAEEVYNLTDNIAYFNGYRAVFAKINGETIQIASLG